jgi:hypothetical protein
VAGDVVGKKLRQYLQKIKGVRVLYEKIPSSWLLIPLKMLS